MAANFILTCLPGSMAIRAGGPLPMLIPFIYRVLPLLLELLLHMSQPPCTRQKETIDDLLDGFLLLIPAEKSRGPSYWTPSHKPKIEDPKLAHKQLKQQKQRFSRAAMQTGDHSLRANACHGVERVRCPTLHCTSGQVMHITSAKSPHYAC